MFWMFIHHNWRGSFRKVTAQVITASPERLRKSWLDLQIMFVTDSQFSQTKMPKRICRRTLISVFHNLRMPDMFWANQKIIYIYIYTPRTGKVRHGSSGNFKLKFASQLYQKCESSRSRDTSSLRCTRVYSKFYGACPKVLGCKSNIAWSVRSKDRVDYVALINLYSTNFETACKGKRKYKPGEEFYQVERLVSRHSDWGSDHQREWCS